jgi:glycosyltransferase involved in cell wall biosynthesis
MSERIAVVTTSYPQPGDDVSGHFVRSEVMALVSAGHFVTVFCPGSQATTALDTAESLPSLTVLRLGAEQLFGWPGAIAKARANPLRLLSLPGFVRRARAQLRGGNFDRVIAHWLIGSGWPIALAARAPVEVVVHGSDARLLTRLGPAREHILRALEQSGCSLRLVAPHLKPLLATASNQAWLGSARVEPSPISMPALDRRETLRRELGVAQDAFLAVVVGRLVPSKRVELALRRAPFPLGAKVVVVGSGPLLADLGRAFPNVHFTGQLSRERALAWLRAADVVVSASREEGAPTALREARQLGTTVWTAEFGSASAWAKSDPGIVVLPEFT